MLLWELPAGGFGRWKCAGGLVPPHTNPRGPALDSADCPEVAEPPFLSEVHPMKHTTSRWSLHAVFALACLPACRSRSTSGRSR